MGDAMLTVWSWIIDALALGSLYAIVAASMVVVFRATGVLNFAQGQMVALAGYIAFSLGGLGFALAAVLTILIMALVGALIHFAILRPLVGYPHWVPLMATFGLAIILEGTIDIGWQQGVFTMPVPWKISLVHLGGGAALTAVDLTNIGVTILAIAILWLITGPSRLGARFRAIAEAPLLAAQSGMRVSSYHALAWCLCGVMSAIGALGYVSGHLVSPTLSSLALLSFPALLIGGLDSLGGALAGGFIVGLLTVLSTVLLGAAASSVGGYVALVVILLLRPRGLFGSVEVSRV
jgi:branched-chain amino acid transport system permease protein